MSIVAEGEKLEGVGVFLCEVALKLECPSPSVPAGTRTHWLSKKLVCMYDVLQHQHTKQLGVREGSSGEIGSGGK